MLKYKDFAPTPFDTKGLLLDDRQDWFVVPCSRTRDSGPLEESNFHCALKYFGGESETVEVHRFGHWGPGWFEIILVAPEHAKQLYELENALEDYPVLNDIDFSDREYEDFLDSWNNWGHREFCKAVQREFDLWDSAYDRLNYNSDICYDFIRDMWNCHSSDEMSHDILRIVNGLDRKQLVQLFREIRKANTQGKGI